MVQPKFLKRIGAFAAAAALSAALAPGVAFAANYSDTTVSNSTTGPDNVVAVNWSEGSDNFTCNVDLDSSSIAKYTSRMGALFQKNNADDVPVYNVIGTTQWVRFSDVISAASVTVGSGPTAVTHYATTAWNNDSDTVAFKVWNKDKTTNVYAVEDYTKYTLGFTKAKLANCNNFYGGTLANTLVTDTTAEYANGAILALNGQSLAMTDGDTTTTAQDVLDGMSGFATSTSPRLMWGYESASIMGNRFPSNIDVITISDVA